MQTKLKFIGLIVILAATAVSLAVWRHSRPGVTKANYDRIEFGMSEAEVEAMLGERPLERLLDDSVEDGDAPPSHRTWLSTN